MAGTVISFGEMLWDLLPDGPALGGAPFNFAYRVHTLGEAGMIITRLGRDEPGARACERAAELGMDTFGIQWDADRPTGTVNVTLDEDRNPDFNIVADVAYDYIEPTDGLISAAASAEWICFGTLCQRGPKSRATLRELLAAGDRAVKFLDINLRKDCYTPETVSASLERADILKLNDAEAGRLGGLFGIAGGPAGFCDGVMDRFGLTHCLVTFGERGALAASAEGPKVYEPGFKVDPVDTTGSGDAFGAGFVHRLAGGAGLAEACRFGNALGALVATQYGATSPISPAEIERFLAGPADRVVEPSLKEFVV